MRKMNVSCDKQKCCVKGCGSTRKMKFHQLPKKKSVGLLWIKATQNFHLAKLTYQELLRKRHLICSLHLRTEDYIFGVRKKLKERAVPSLCLPEINESNASPSNMFTVNVNESINCQELSSIAVINCSPKGNDFSPVSLKKRILNSESSPRKSSLTFADDYALISTPKSHSKSR